MPDDKSDSGPADRSRINVNERYEVDYWKKEFGVSELKLRRAVDTVGVSVSKVRAWLKSN